MEEDMKQKEEGDGRGRGGGDDSGMQQVLEEEMKQEEGGDGSSNTLVKSYLQCFYAIPHANTPYIYPSHYS